MSAAIFFLCSVVLVVFVTEYIAIYYEKRNSEVPGWVYWSAMSFFAVLISFAYAKFAEAFSREENKGH